MKSLPQALVALISLLCGGSACATDLPTDQKAGAEKAPAATAAASPHENVKAEAKTRVACVGDSITQGVGAAKGGSYPAQLQRLLGDQWQVLNFGVSGRTMLRKGDNPYWNEKQFQEALASKPGAVIIMLGTNDTKPQNWKHKGEFADDYRDMVRQFLALDPKPRVFICRPVPVPGAGNFGINEAGVQEQIPMLDALAKELGVQVIDMHAALARKPETLPDRVHPNTAGAAEMAKAAYTALTGKAAPADIPAASKPE